MTCPMNLSGNVHLFRTCSKQGVQVNARDAVFVGHLYKLVTIDQVLLEYPLSAISYPVVLAL